MKRICTSDLREKEIINICNGTKLGCPCDFEFDLGDGRVTALVLTQPNGFLGLGKAKELWIPWQKIECIGDDAILVRLLPSDLECLCPEEKKNKKW